MAAHVVLCCRLRQPFFNRHDLAEATFDLICESTRTIAACLMPDHLHWLIAEPANMASLVGRFKSSSTHRAWSLGHHGRLWQRSFSDRLIRNQEQMAAAIDYIRLNPMRSGLTLDPHDYVYLRVP